METERLFSAETSRRKGADRRCVIDNQKSKTFIPVQQKWSDTGWWCPEWTRREVYIQPVCVTSNSSTLHCRTMAAVAVWAIGCGLFIRAVINKKKEQNQCFPDMVKSATWYVNYNMKLYVCPKLTSEIFCLYICCFFLHTASFKPSNGIKMHTKYIPDRLCTLFICTFLSNHDSDLLAINLTSFEMFHHVFCFVGLVSNSK